LASLIASLVAARRKVSRVVRQVIGIHTFRRIISEPNGRFYALNDSHDRRLSFCKVSIADVVVARELGRLNIAGNS
jgi:hypothetical protein